MSGDTIEISLNSNARQVAFSEWQARLFSQANELAIFCDAEVAVIIFSDTGKVFEYSSSDMKTILARFNKCSESRQSSSVETNPEGIYCFTPKKQGPNEIDVLRKEIDVYKQKIDVHKQEVDALKQQIGSYKEEFRKFILHQQYDKREIDILKQTNGFYYEQVGIYNQQIGHFISKQQYDKREIDLLKQQIGVYKQDFGVLTQQIGVLKEENRKLKSSSGPSSSKRKTPDNGNHSNRNENVE